MKKWFLMLAALLMIAAPGSVLASARQDGLSTDIRQVEDIDLIWLYPNKILQYKNTADFRLGDATNHLPTNTGNEWGGLITDADGLGVGTLAFYVNRPGLMPSPWAAITNIVSIWPSVLSTTDGPVGGFSPFLGFVGHNLDLFWADSLGDGADLGIHLHYTDYFRQLGPTADSQAYGVGAGLALTGGLFSEFNLHADFSFQNIKGAMPPFFMPDGIDGGIRSLKLGALGQAEISKDFYVRPFVDFQIESFDAGGLAPVPISFRDCTFVVGSAFNHSILKGKGLVSTGLTFGYNNNNLESTFGPPSINELLYQLVLNAAVEAQVADWLTLRGGAATNLVARFYNSVGYTGMTWGDLSSNPVVGSVGFSVNVQNVTLDAAVRAASFEDKVANPEPGGGIFFPGGFPLVVYTADLKYKF